MKKLFFILTAVIGFGFSTFSQDAVINENANDSKYYWINGISSKEDIGGVDVETTKLSNGTKIVFTNYNTSTVTVYYKIKNANNEILTGNRVLKPNEAKIIVDGDNYNYTTGVEIKIITRKLAGSANVSVEEEIPAKPETKKTLKGFDYVAISIGGFCLLVILIGYREARQQSKIRKKLKNDAYFLQRKSHSELREFIATDMYFLTEDDKKELNNIAADDYTDARDLRNKMQELIQDVGGSQILVYIAVITVITVAIILLFRLGVVDLVYNNLSTMLRDTNK
ncbi:MAG: hypothetical protein FWC39_02680 [Bacteroidetes bacterium]|nr:hypothetical protein [Bacteroidota bacterium]